MIKIKKIYVQLQKSKIIQKITYEDVWVFLNELKVFCIKNQID